MKMSAYWVAPQPSYLESADLVCDKVDREGRRPVHTRVGAPGDVGLVTAGSMRVAIYRCAPMCDLRLVGAEFCHSHRRDHVPDQKLHKHERQARPMLGSVNVPAC